MKIISSISNTGHTLYFTINKDKKSVTIYDSVYNSDITGHLEIPSTITYKGKTYAVTNYDKEYTFFESGGITAISFPKTITSISEKVFSFCSEITAINVAKGNPAYTSIDGILYNNDTTKLIRCPYGKQGRVVIPPSVQQIEENAFGWCETVSEIIIPTSVKIIANAAFCACKKLTSISIPHSVVKIDDEAFKECENLTTITIPHSIISIGNDVFDCCPKLIEINVDSNNPFYTSINGVLYDRDVTTLIRCPEGKIGRIVIPNSVKCIKSYAFSHCNKLTSIFLPNSITKIEDGAFYGCAKLKTITIPNIIKTIMQDTFSNCKRLSKINIPHSVSKILGYAFEGCEKLTTISIPNSVTKIKGNVFFNCSALSEICVEQDNPNYTSIDGVLYDKEVTRLINYPKKKSGHFIIPNTVTIIENGAFEDCIDLTGITIPNSVIRIKEDAFSGCINLKEVVLPNSITTIEAFSFMDCTNLSSITIPNSVIRIKNDAFKRCEGLVDITLPDSVQEIDSDAFYGCNSLTALTIPNHVTKIGSIVFSCKNLQKITIPSSVKRIENSVFEFCPNLISIDVAAGNPMYMSIDGVLYNRQATKLICCPRGKRGDVVIPDSVDRIGENAFSECAEITSIILPKKLKKIGDSAFSDCKKLQSIILPHTLTEIGYNTFCNCKSFTSIFIPNTITSIEEDAFYACSNLSAINVEAGHPIYTSIDGVVYSKDKKKLIYCPEGKKGCFAIPNTTSIIEDSAFCHNYALTRIIVPNTVKRIKKSAFHGCQKLKEVVISASVKCIEENAFRYCDKLKSITCQSVTPPMIYSTTFHGYDYPEEMIISSYNVPLYVPEMSVEAYKQHPIWGNFTTILPIEQKDVSMSIQTKRTKKI